MARARICSAEVMADHWPAIASDPPRPYRRRTYECWPGEEIDVLAEDIPHLPEWLFDPPLPKGPPKVTVKLADEETMVRRCGEVAFSWRTYRMRAGETVEVAPHDYEELKAHWPWMLAEEEKETAEAAPEPTGETAEGGLFQKVEEPEGDNDAQDAEEEADEGDDEDEEKDEVA